jgi:protein gp37
MNRTPIEWTDFTWNPVTGCLHPCRLDYCYNTVKATAPLNRFGARFLDDRGELTAEKVWRNRQNGGLHVAKKGEIYPFGYDPTFYPHRLSEPTKRKKPSKIFVVDTGDLLGHWVPEDWVETVFEVIASCPQHAFQVLTKNPVRLVDREIPDNLWVGTSVSTNADLGRVETVRGLSAPVKFLSIEPLLGPIEFDANGLDWLIIGAQTGKNAIPPAQEWVETIVNAASAAAVPLFLKDNLGPFYPTAIRQFPIPRARENRYNSPARAEKPPPDDVSVAPADVPEKLQRVPQRPNCKPEELKLSGRNQDLDEALAELEGHLTCAVGCLFIINGEEGVPDIGTYWWVAATQARAAVKEWSETLNWELQRLDEVLDSVASKPQATEPANYAGQTVLSGTAVEKWSKFEVFSAVDFSCQLSRLTVDIFSRFLPYIDKLDGSCTSIQGLGLHFGIATGGRAATEANLRNLYKDLEGGDEYVMALMRFVAQEPVVALPILNEIRNAGIAAKLAVEDESLPLAVRQFAWMVLTLGAGGS